MRSRLSHDSSKKGRSGGRERKDARDEKERAEKERPVRKTAHEINKYRDEPEEFKEARKNDANIRLSNKLDTIKRKNKHILQPFFGVTHFIFLPHLRLHSYQTPAQ